MISSLVPITKLLVLDADLLIPVRFVIEHAKGTCELRAEMPDLKVQEKFGPPALPHYYYRTLGFRADRFDERAPHIAEEIKLLTEFYAAVMPLIDHTHIPPFDIPVSAYRLPVFEEEVTSDELPTDYSLVNDDIGVRIKYKNRIVWEAKNDTVKMPEKVTIPVQSVINRWHAYAADLENYNEDTAERFAAAAAAFVKDLKEKLPADIYVRFARKQVIRKDEGVTVDEQ